MLNELALGCMAALVAGVWWFFIWAMLWRGETPKDEDAFAIFGGIPLLMFLFLGLGLLADDLQDHQEARQLRRPALLGARAFQQRRAITVAAALLGCIGLPLAADLALGEPAPEVDDDHKTAWRMWSAARARRAWARTTRAGRCMRTHSSTAGCRC